MQVEHLKIGPIDVSSTNFWVPIDLTCFKDSGTLPNYLKIWVQINITPQWHLSKNICKPK